MTVQTKLQEVLQTHHMLSQYRDREYLQMMETINRESANILDNHLGAQFVRSCAKDLCGEIIRTYLPTSQFYVTVDQMFLRVVKFRYDNEYDPLKENAQIRKNVYNYSVDRPTAEALRHEMDGMQTKLFELDRSKDSADSRARQQYRDSRRSTSPDGSLYDDITGVKEKKSTVGSNGKEYEKSNLDADHIQSRAQMTINDRYLTAKGVEELRSFVNSGDNMQMMLDVANRSKGDVRVCVNGNGKVEYLSTKDAAYDPKNDITHRATPDQMADAICAQLEKETSPEKLQALKENGYLNEDGKVPKAVRNKLDSNVRHSQNKESIIILKNADYKQIKKDAVKETKANFSKILAGQLAYYALPPIVYEIRCLVEQRGGDVKSVLARLKDAFARVGKYVFSHVKDIVANTAHNAIKDFIKNFFEILLNMVKATIKKIMSVLKNLVLATTDAIRILCSRRTTPAQKADAVVNLYAVTITNCALELLFEWLKKYRIPDFVLNLLRMFSVVICTNMVMLILQQADLFGVQYGFKMEKIRQLFADEQRKFDEKMRMAREYTNETAEMLLAEAERENKEIMDSLSEIDMKTQSVMPQADRIVNLFGMDVDIAAEWEAFT